MPARASLDPYQNTRLGMGTAILLIQRAASTTNNHEPGQTRAYAQPAQAMPTSLKPPGRASGFFRERAPASEPAISEPPGSRSAPSYSLMPTGFNHGKIIDNICTFLKPPTMTSSMASTSDRTARQRWRQGPGMLPALIVVPGPQAVDRAPADRGWPHRA